MADKGASDTGTGRSVGTTMAALEEKYSRSPRQVVSLIALSVFVTEAVVMAILHFIPGISVVTEVFIDSALLVLMLSPSLYFFLFRPLLHLIDDLAGMEREAVAERDRAHGYFDIAGSIIVVLDRSGNVRLINRSGCEILERTESEILGANWFDEFVAPGDRTQARAAHRALLEGTMDRGTIESSLLTKSSRERIIRFHNTPLSEQGRITGTLSSGEDVTERIKALEALRESEAKYRLVHDTSFDGIILSNYLDLIIDCNPSVEKIFGYTKEELLGMEITELMPEKYRSRHIKGLKRFLETRTSSIQGRVLELEGLRKNGRYFPIELVLNSFTIGGEVHFTGTIRDITERRRAEKERAVIQAQLNQSQKMEAIGRLAGGIAHDFNNLLTSIRGNAELALEDIDPESPARDRLDAINLSVLHSAKLTRQLLLFSRGEEHEPVPLNISAVIENLLDMISHLIGDEIEVRASLADDIWTVEADEGGIEQVVMNLAVNARDAMPNGGTLTIETVNVKLDDEACAETPEARPGPTVRLSVRDSGEGMEKEVLERIFEPFFSTKESERGGGFGLSVVYSVVKRQGGWLTVQSGPGEGTLFEIYLPAAPDEAGDGEKREEVRTHRPRGAGERVLLVEEETRVRSFAATALKANGYDVFAATDAEHALRIFDEQGRDFALAFCDVVLGDASGLRLVEELVSRRPGLNVLLTGSLIDMKARVDRSKERGFKYLQKPYSVSSLLRAVSHAIGENVTEE